MEQPWTLHIVSTTHWDREWYYSFQQFRKRLVKLMDRLLDLLERNPEFRSFTLDGQFLALRDYLEIRPEKETQIRKFVKEGRLLIGPWYTQPTETLSSGESLIRNLMLGIRKSIEFGGVLKTCYLPDEFGHITQLPQICRGFGMEDLAAWRGIPRDSKSVFRWTGADGTEVLLFYINGGYGDSTALPEDLEDFDETIDDTVFRRMGLRNRMTDAINRRGPKATTPHLLLLNGIDHAFAQENLPLVIKTINHSIPGMHARHSTLQEYTEAVKSEYRKDGLNYDRYHGEMMDHAESPVLLDVHSMRVDVKMWNKRVEDLFEKWMEPFAAYAWLLGAPYPGSEIWKAWEYLLENQTHDSIDCSSLDAVYRQVLTRFEWAWELGNEIVNESLLILVNKIAENINLREQEKALVLFNPLSRARSEVISATVDIPGALNFNGLQILDGNVEIPVLVRQKSEEVTIKYNPLTGCPTPLEVSRYELLLWAADIPANGYKVLNVVNTDRQRVLTGGLVKSHHAMENESLRVELNSDGTFDLTDKRTGQQYLNLHFFEDSGEAGNGFESEKPENDRLLISTGVPAEISIMENSPLRSTFRVDFVWNLPEGLRENRTCRSRSVETVPCHFSSLITLTAGAPRVDIETSVHNLARDHRLRVIFPTGIRTESCYAEQPFDVVKRGIAMPDPNLTWVERPRAIRPQQSFVDVNDGEKGIMLANHGLYEYEVMEDEDRSIALTLLRCTDKLYAWYHSQVREERLPQAQCLGEYIFRYSVIPHPGNWDAASEDAYAYKFPVRAVLQKDLEEAVLPGFKGYGGETTLSGTGSFLQLEASGVTVTAVKKQEVRHSLVIRLLNTMDSPAKGRIRINAFGRSPLEIFQINLNEEREESLGMGADGWLDFEIREKGLLTLEWVME